MAILWIAVVGWDANFMAALTGTPAGFDDMILVPSNNSGGVQLALVMRKENIASIDPDTFVFGDIEQFISATFAIPFGVSGFNAPHLGTD